MADKDDIFFDFDDDDNFLKEKPGEGTPKPAPADDFTLDLDLESDHGEDKPASRRRTSQDFEKDMDTLLITAQSSMIIEGLRLLTEKDFSSRNLPVYLESIKGVDLFITLLGRDPMNYKKLSKIFSTDIDCQRIEKVTVNLYNNIYNEPPGSDVQWIRAFELLKDTIVTAYNKTSINCAMQNIRKYFLLSGGLDETKLRSAITTFSAETTAEMQQIVPQIQNAISMLKAGKGEMSPGMKGKDMNIFIIKASQLLYVYYRETGQVKLADYYLRIYDNYKKYFVIR